MEYQPVAPPHTDIFENFIDTQRYAGHLSEGGPLPAYLLANKFEETPGVFDPHSFYDFTRMTLADFRPDPPLFEDETPRDTTKWSGSRMNVLHRGSRSGADPANHPEMFYGFLDQDTRTPGDDHFPAWRIAQQGAARARYLKPTEPEGASHLSEGVPGDIETETERFKKLQKARAWASQNVHMFGRTIEDDHARGGRDWMPLPCAPGIQGSEGGAGSAGVGHETQMRSQLRSEYTPGDEKKSVQREARRRNASDAAALRAAHACAARGGIDLQFAEMQSSVAAPARRDASAKSAEHSRIMAHKARGPSEVQPEDAPLQGPRGGVSLGALAENMKRGCHPGICDMVDEGAVSGGTVGTRSWHLDVGDPLALLHRATERDAVRQQEILEVATQLSMRTTLGPWSMPHLAIGLDGKLLQAKKWSGGPTASQIDDAVPTYLVVEALRMKRACMRPRETDLIRRKMIVDARKPTGTEIQMANQTAGMLARVRSATEMSSKTARDIEMASDALELYNAKAASIGSTPASWHHAHGALTETQLIAEPDHGLASAKTAAPRESSGAEASALRVVMGASHEERMSKVDGPGFGRNGRRKGDVSDGVEEAGERERFASTARFTARRGPSHQFAEADAPMQDI